LWLSHLSILQVVFLVVTGEAWGFLGSRRFLHELDQQSGAVAGLNATLIEEVLFFYPPTGLALMFFEALCESFFNLSVLSCNELLQMI